MSFVPFSQDTLRELDIAHEDIRVVRGETPPAKSWNPDFKPEHPWEAVFRKPTVGEAESFEGKAHNDRARPAALREFAKALVVGVSLNGKQTTCMDRKDQPSRREVVAAWDALRDRYPNAHVAAQEDIFSLSGQARDEGGKD